MASQNKLRTYKIKRNEAKKRKLEAFLELVRQDSSQPLQRKKKCGGTFQENYKALKNELRKYQKKTSSEPLFCLKEGGRCALVNLTLDNQKSSCIEPLFVEDIHHLLVTSVLANLSPFPLCWAKLQHAQNICKTVFLEIEGLSKSDIIEMQCKFNQNCNVFPFIIEILSSNKSFAMELSTLHLVTDFYNQSKDKYSSLFPIDQIQNVNKKLNSKNNISKLHLLLSPIQLAMEHYPLPQNIFEQSKSEGYCFSKETYNPVHENSPMFAVDCEMCRTISGRQVVTRIAIVNEDLETVYHTLVKPEEEIADYITRISGITEKMLQNVTTTLEDVQNDMRKILPSDAILCGQSLNCDLHGLKMIHPYVIDTSVIFNEHGVRQRKTSLKQLARKHLQEIIQDGKKGHSPIEDSIATMKLVQLKLEKFIEYGDSVLFDTPEDFEITNEIKENASSTFEKERKSSDFIKLNPESSNDGFFSIISKFSKRVCIIGSENSLNNYCSEMITTDVLKVVKSKLKKIIKATTDCVEQHDLILSHLVLESESLSSAELSDEIKQIYENFPKKTLFIIFVSGINEPIEGKLRKNYCMITLKPEKTT